MLPVFSMAVVDGATDTRYTLGYQARIGRCVFLAEVESALDLSFVDIVADTLHKCVVFACGAVDHEGALNEDIDADQCQQGNYNHQWSAFEAEVPERKLHLVSGCNRCAVDGSVK